MLAGGGVEADNAPLIAWDEVEQPVVSGGAVTERKVSGARDWIADGEAVGWAQRRATFDVSSSVAIVGSAACRPSVAPGKPTLVSPVRMPCWPVMNAARPAVQLCSA